jgi:hypothetical protein
MCSLAALHRELREITAEMTALLGYVDNPEAMNLAAQLPPKLIEMQDCVNSALGSSDAAEAEFLVVQKIRIGVKHIYAEVSGLRSRTSDAGVWAITSKILQRLVKIQCDLPTPGIQKDIENSENVEFQVGVGLSESSNFAATALPTAGTPEMGTVSATPPLIPFSASFPSPVRLATRPPVLPSPGNSKRKVWANWLRNFGLDGFGVSILVHIGLVVLALTWVVASYTVNPGEKTEHFVTGAGGGAQGSEARTFEHKVRMKNPKNMTKTMPRLTSRNANSAVSLPEMPVFNMNLQGGLTAGNLSKGLGGGSGGGIGSGMGIGAGGGKNLVAKWVMGVKMEAKKIAVYLDCSGSMVPFLENVKAEIRSQYPDADIFEIRNIRITVQDNKVRGGRFYIPAKTKRAASFSQTSSATKVSTKKNPAMYKTPAAKSINSREAVLKKWEANFDANGSVGAWMDIMLFEGYDALVVFSDFQDGIHQRNASREKIYDESFLTEKFDSRRAVDKAWEREWIERCSDKEKGPRIYLFSIQVEPQEIWQKCVEASGGAVKMMPELRQQRGRAARRRGVAETSAESEVSAPEAPAPEASVSEGEPASERTGAK